MQLRLRVRGEPETFWIPTPAKSYVNLRYPPHECYCMFGYTQTPLEQRTHEAPRKDKCRERPDNQRRDVHELMAFTYDHLKQACEEYCENYGSIRRFKNDLKEAARLADTVYESRIQSYANFCHTCSNNRGRILELRAYAFLSLGLLQLAKALTEEPQ